MYTTVRFTNMIVRLQYIMARSIEMYCCLVLYRTLKRKKADAVAFCNSTKSEVYILDQMVRQYST
jgi:hypothetical protein